MSQWHVTNQLDRLIDDCKDVLDDLEVWLGCPAGKDVRKFANPRGFSAADLILRAAKQLADAIERAQE